MYLAVLGIQPRLSFAELYRVQINAEPHGPNTATFQDSPSPHLGGTSKIAGVIDDIPTVLQERIKRHVLEHVVEYLPDTGQKLPIGISIYGARWPAYKSFCFDIKKQLRKHGYKPRIILGDDQALNSAQILHNRLDTNRSELIISIGQKTTLICRTEWIQDINSYTKRDIGRPCRNMKVGMLPPKLAQIMINLATGSHIYDPFCGSGVILQEALLMHKQTSGSDIEPDMTECTNKNLQWLMQKFDIPPAETVFTADARVAIVPTGVDAIVSEGYLGPIITEPQEKKRLEELSLKSDRLWREVLHNLYPQLESGTRLCLALPAWPYRGDYIMPALAIGIDDKDSLGYNQLSLAGITNNDLLYRRHDQFVGRQLILLEKV